MIHTGIEMLLPMCRASVFVTISLYHSLSVCMYEYEHPAWSTYMQLLIYAFLEIRGGSQKNE